MMGKEQRAMSNEYFRGFRHWPAGTRPLAIVSKTGVLSGEVVAFKDWIQGLDSRTAFKDCVQGLHSRTVFKDCIQVLRPRTAFKDCIQGLHSSTAFKDRLHAAVSEESVVRLGSRLPRKAHDLFSKYHSTRAFQIQHDAATTASDQWVLNNGFSSVGSQQQPQRMQPKEE